MVLVLDLVVLALPAVGLAAVDGALAGGAALRDGAVRGVRGARGGFLVFVGLGGWGGGGEADRHEEGGAEEGELHGVGELVIEGRKVVTDGVTWSSYLIDGDGKQFPSMKSGPLYRQSMASSLRFLHLAASFGSRSEHDGKGSPRSMQLGGTTGRIY